MTVDRDRYPPELAFGVTSSRIRDLTTAARALHKTILRGFATVGQAPGPRELAAASQAGHDVGVLLGELHDRDVVRLGSGGRIRVAYPFSAVPTAHTAKIAGGPTVFAMCAIDALGIADMLGTAVSITSVDPRSGEPISVVVRDGRAIWRPNTTVVLVGSDTAATAATAACCTADGESMAAAADRCCGVMNFFAGPGSAQAWLAAHQHVTGVVLTQGQAFRLGVDIFGHLLDD
jgi:hypothetical protein